MLYSSSVDFLGCWFGYFFLLRKRSFEEFPRTSMEIPRWKKMIPPPPARCTPSRSEANSHAERTLAGVTQCPIPTMHGIMSKPRDGWEQARADLTPVFSCLSGGIKEGSELPRVRTRGHRHKPARGKFLLEVRKDFSPWGCSNVLRLSRKTAESPWLWGDTKLEWTEPRANWSASTCSELGAG